MTKPARILTASAIFIIYWFKVYFTTEPLPSVDLPSFIHITELLRSHWWKGELSFYDPTNFTGWVPFQFYGVLPALVTALFSYPITFFTDDSVRLATHLLMVLGSALLPFTFYYAALPVLAETSGIEPTRKERSLLALSCATFAFWFLNHDKQWFGVGAAAVMHIGLFSQIFGWHFLLFFLGSTARALSTNNRKLYHIAAISFAGLILSHTLTWVFAGFVALVLFFWFSQLRRFIAISMMLGTLLSMFWFMPMLSFMGEYTAFDIYRPTGDFLEIFLRYPLYNLLRGIGSGGSIKALNPTYLFLPFLILYLFASNRVKKSSLIFALLITTLCSVLTFSSDYVASSLPTGLHYYRFLAYAFLLLTLTLIPVPVLIAKEGSINRTLFISAMMLLCFGSTIALPHYERELIYANRERQYLSAEDKVVQYFAAQPQKGRIFTEYLTDYKKFAPLSAHYLAYELVKRSGFEVVASSHVQESVAYRMLVVSANLLRANTYNAPLLFTDRASLADQTKIDQLKSFGITHIVVGTEKLAAELKRFSIGEPVQFGRYRIYKISEAVANVTTVTSKKVIGYIDRSKSLPFSFVQYFFYARDSFRNYELINLDASADSTIPVDAYLLNLNPASASDKKERERLATFKPVVPLSYKETYSLDHYHVQYMHNMELDRYNDAERYLTAQNLDDKLKQISNSAGQKEDGATPQFTWSDNLQTINLTGMTPGKLYRLNYSYFPYWHSNDGEVLRGSMERIFFRAKSENATLYFSRWRSASTWLGILLTIVGISLLRSRLCDQ